MGNNAWNDKNKFIWLLFCFFIAFLVTSGISYKVAHDSLSQQIESNTSRSQVTIFTQNSTGPAATYLYFILDGAGYFCSRLDIKPRARARKS